MLMARIAIDPELWRKARVKAFETGQSGAEIVNEALRQFLAGPQTKASVSSDGAPRSARPPKVEIGGVIEESHDEGGVTVIDKIRVTETSVVREEEPWTTAATPKLIETPKEAAERAAQLTAARPEREFHPVPKPTPKSGRSRSRSGSRTSETGK